MDDPVADEFLADFQQTCDEKERAPIVVGDEVGHAELILLNVKYEYYDEIYSDGSTVPQELRVYEIQFGVHDLNFEPSALISITCLENDWVLEDVYLVRYDGACLLVECGEITQY